MSLSLRRLSGFWAITVVILFLATFFYEVWLLSLVFLVILLNAAHESIHNNLFKSEKMNKCARYILYALIGHNAYLISSSHSFHHIYGRYPHKDFLVERRYEIYTLRDTVEYYALLFGAGYYWNFFGGFVCCILPKKKAYFFADQKVSHFIFCGVQFLTAALHIALCLHAPLFYLCLFISFGLYWGLSQNAPHYGLENSEDTHRRHIARCYSVNSLVHFIFFGTMFSHIQHHFFQELPGVELSDSSLDQEIGKQLGVNILRKSGRYWIVDLLKQFKGPTPDVLTDWMIHEGCDN